MKNNDNKRKIPRQGCRVPVEGKKDSLFESLETVDISKNGLGFISTHRIPVNKKIPIEINLSEDEDPVLVVGKVEWNRVIKGTDNYRIGVSFDSIMRGSKSRLLQYFKSL